LIKSTYQVRDGIEQIRTPFITGNEFPKGYMETSDPSAKEYGQAVGWAYNVDDSHGFIYDDGGLLDLNDLLSDDLNWLITEAWDINDRGQIVGRGIFDGEQRAVLLNPTSAAPVPLPSTLILLGTAIAGLIISKRETGADGCCEGLITGCDQLDI
jgi:hypothetical protein